MLLAIVTRNREILVTLLLAIRKTDAIVGCWKLRVESHLATTCSERFRRPMTWYRHVSK